MIPDVVHGDSGEIERAVEFDYSAVEKACFHNADLPEVMTREEAEEMAVVLLTSVCGWIWQYAAGTKNSKGQLIRSAIVAWVFLPEVQAMTLTELSRSFGKHKQSFGRWVDDFKVRFPNVRNPNMKD